MLHRCYGVAPHARLEERAGAHVLVSDYPLRQFNLNEAAWRLVQALDGRTPLDALVEEVSAETVAFLEDKVTAGLLSAAYRLSPPGEWPRVDVIVPAYGNLPALTRCLEGLAAQTYRRDSFSVIVVDDASPGSLLDGLVGHDFDGMTTRWRHLKVNLGPGEARNAGAGVFHSTAMPGRVNGRGALAPLLAFLDSDCVPAPNWLETLVSVLEEPLLAGVGGGVRGLDPQSWIGHYEAACASLFMGEQAGPAALPRGRVPYLPACNLLLRRDAFEAVDGFRAGMRLGEDVDLCWRLAAEGHALFYYPPGEVRHDYRVRVGAFLRRKREYATSEAALRRHHPRRFHGGSRLPFATGLGAAGAGLELGIPSLFLAGLLLPLLAAAVAAIHAGRGLRTFGARRVAAAWLRGTAARLLQDARRFTRITLVFWVFPLAAYPRLAALAVLAFVLGACGEWLHRRPAISPLVFLAGFAAECLAYSVGKAEGELRACTAPLARGLGRLFRRGGEEPATAAEQPPGLAGEVHPPRDEAEVQ